MRNGHRSQTPLAPELLSTPKESMASCRAPWTDLLTSGSSVRKRNCAIGCQTPDDHTGGETHTGLTVLSHVNALSDVLKAGWSIKMEFIHITGGTCHPALRQKVLLDAKSRIYTSQSVWFYLLLPRKDWPVLDFRSQKNKQQHPDRMQKKDFRKATYTVSMN